MIFFIRVFDEQLNDGDKIEFDEALKDGFMKSVLLIGLAT